jgi:hypothetical protein
VWEPVGITDGNIVISERNFALYGASLGGLWGFDSVNAGCGGACRRPGSCLVMDVSERLPVGVADGDEALLIQLEVVSSQGGGKRREISARESPKSARRQWTGKQIAAETSVSPATVSRVLRRLGLNKLSALEPAELIVVMVGEVGSWPWRGRRNSPIANSANNFTILASYWQHSRRSTALSPQRPLIGRDDLAQILTDAHLPRHQPAAGSRETGLPK